MANITLQEMYDEWKKSATGVGAPADAEATSGNGTIIGILKAIRTAAGSALVTLGSAIGTKGQLVAGSDGANARALKTTSDGTLLTQLTGSKVMLGDDQVVTRTNTTIAAGVIETVATIDKPIMIDSLFFYETKGSTQIRYYVEFKSKAGTWQGQGSYLEAGRFRFSHLRNAGHHLFEIVKDDTTGNIYTFQLKKQIPAVYGLRIRVENIDTVSQTVMTFITYREAI